tara:strand:+ start:712 stop:924 length:213 start_codon:yes stop_codon:yes gene_type:complete
MFLSIWIILLSLAVIYLFIGVFIIISNQNNDTKFQILNTLIEKDVLDFDDSWEDEYSKRLIKKLKKKNKD